MKYIINYLGALLAVLFISATFTACTDDDDNGSAHPGLGIKAFFPTKVVTNQPMTISGSGFAGATEVVFPDGVQVTNFEIVNDGMIRLNAPDGIADEGGKIIVRSDGKEAESSQTLTVGNTTVTGFSKQPGETASGNELITVYGTDLEFINGIELLDTDGNPIVIDQKDFYRKGTDNLIFRVPPKNIFEGTFTGYLLTYDGQRIPIPEMTYEPASEGGHMEIVKTVIWENGGQLGEINWSSDYRFGLEGHDGANECIATFPQEIWDRLRTETFYVTIKGANPQIEITDGWWSARGFTFAPGSEQLTDNGDGTWTLAVTLPEALLNVIDSQHMLFTGSGYSVEEIYFAEEVWVDGGEEDTTEIIWENGGQLGGISWSGAYRFGLEGHDGANECIATFPQDIWDRLRTGPFYVTIKGEDPQIEITDGWWSARGFTFAPGSDELTDNGDGTWTLVVTLPEALLNVIDSQHMLFTGDRYSVETIYFK